MTFMTIQCNECSGEGWVRERDPFSRHDMNWVNCFSCDGDGRKPKLIQQGDGSWAKLLSEDRCVICKTAMTQPNKCNVCGLRYGNG